MKKTVWYFLIIAAIGLAAAPSSWAGVASLTDEDVLRLRALVQSLPEAAQWAQGIEKQADQALNDIPHPVAQIQTAGKLQGSSEKTQTQEALKDMPRLQSEALAYVLTGREEYLQQAQAYILSWSRTCQPPDNPIDATNLEPLFVAYDIVRLHFLAENRDPIDQWVRSVAQTLASSDDPKKGTYWNNWKSHRLKIIGLAAFTLNDATLEKWTLDALKALLERNLNADGTTLDFLERDALHYQVYDLEPLLTTAILYQRAQGLDLYDLKTSNGSSLRQCVAFVVPFAKGDKTHAEYVHTKVKFDLQRAQNHEKGHGIGEPFDPKAALKCLALAQYFQPDLKPLVGQLAGKPEAAYPTLQILLNDVTHPAAKP